MYIGLTGMHGMQISVVLPCWQGAGVRDAGRRPPEYE